MDIKKKQGFIKETPSLKVKLPKYDVPIDDPAHIFTQKEIKIINAITKLEVALPEAHLVFVKKNDIFEKTELEKKQEELEGMGEKAAFKKNLEDKKKQLEELKEAIFKQTSQAGTTTNARN